MEFKDIFGCFLKDKDRLKVISVASCDVHLKPNSASKMLVDVVAPNQIFFLDYPFTQTHGNISQNPQLSVSFMDDAGFTGYRLTGEAEILASGKEFEAARKRWEKRLVSYEADRIIERIRGNFSTREAENSLPKNFVIVKFTAHEGSAIKPDRVFRALRKE